MMCTVVYDDRKYSSCTVEISGVAFFIPIPTPILFTGAQWMLSVVSGR